MQKLQHMVKTGEVTWATLDDGLTKELEQARVTLEEAADIAGHIDAQHVVGDMYGFGQGVPVDKEKVHFSVTSATRDAVGAVGVTHYGW